MNESKVPLVRRKAQAYLLSKKIRTRGEK